LEKGKRKYSGERKDLEKAFNKKNLGKKADTSVTNGPFLPLKEMRKKIVGLLLSY